jgi:hypothetical protein
MKNKLYKIRNAAREANNEEGSRGPFLASGSRFQHETLNPNAGTHMDRDAQF